MSLATPTTTEINNNIIAQLQISLGQIIPFLPKSFNRVLSKTLAAIFVLLYKYGGFMFLQIFVATASDQATIANGKVFIPIIEWGRLILREDSDPVAATRAEFIVDVTVENQTGALSPGVQLLNVDNGVTYLNLTSVLLDAPVVQITIRAESDQGGGGGAGAIGNLIVGDVVSFANPLPNVARNAVIASVVVTASDVESTTAYRQRIIDAFQKRPQGGAPSDYEIWGEEVAGIINIYPYTADDPGEVDVYTEATVASSGDPDGIPTAAQLIAVEESIEFENNGLASRRPANAFVNVLPITRTGFDSRILGLTGDSLGQLQTDITDAITEFFLDAEPFIDGLTIPPRTDRITRSALISVVHGIVAPVNGSFTSVSFNLMGVSGSLEEYVLQQGEKAKSTGTAFT